MKLRKSRFLRTVDVGQGFSNLTSIRNELQDYIDILLGRKEPPAAVRNDVDALAECANAFLARAREIEAILYAREREGVTPKGSALYKYRTGELRTIIALFDRAYEMGSRRITMATLIQNER